MSQRCHIDTRRSHSAPASRAVNSRPGHGPSVVVLRFGFAEPFCLRARAIFEEIVNLQSGNSSNLGFRSSSD